MRETETRCETCDEIADECACCPECDEHPDECACYCDECNEYPADCICDDERCDGYGGTGYDTPFGNTAAYGCPGCGACGG